MKKRILMVNECSELSTGYSTYGKEVLTRLHNTGKYEIAEFATYVKPNNPKLASIPWKCYINMPTSEEEEASYNSLPTNQFGEFKFEQVCLDFKPHIVFDIRDFWMHEFQERSPFRKCYHWSIMPTVDAAPQNEQWLSTFYNADSVFTYSNWAGKILSGQTNGLIKPLGTAPPAASDDFKPIPKFNMDVIKEKLGLKDFKIVGTVMRNQRRKLFPELFESFSKFLRETKRKDILLYCHTSYPDMGWDIPKLLIQHGLCSKVLFTYKCRNCKHAYPAFFSDAIAVCSNCHQQTATLSNVQDGVDNPTLNFIYNLFDVYIQCANSEGFGMPQVEAAACGTHVMSTDYSAMSDVVRKVNGQPIPLKTKVLEVETGCYRAVPDTDFIVSYLKDYFNAGDQRIQEMGKKAREGFLENYSSWDKTAKVWEDHFDTIDVQKYEQMWKRKPRIHHPATEIPNLQNHSDYVNWLIINVLGEPERLGSFMSARMTRDLSYGATTNFSNGSYLNEHSFSQLAQYNSKFNRENAYNHMVHLCNKRNQWEQLRWESIQ